MFELLGFTDLTSTFWNILAYIGMIVVIVAVVSKKLRDHFFVLGSLILTLYAWFFLHNQLLTALQLIITVSSILNLLKIKNGASLIVGILSAITYILLIISGSIAGFWCLIGSFGLLAICWGFIELPKKRSFAIMAAGGILIILYSGALAIWTWFALNVIFCLVNIIKLLRTKKGGEKSEN